MRKGNGAARTFRKELVGVEGVVAQVFIERAMEGVGAGAGTDIQHAATEASPLGGEVVALHLELLGGLNGGNSGDLVEEAGGGGYAIDLDLVALGAATVDGEVGVPGGVDGDVAELASGGAGTENAGSELDEAKGAASVKRNVLDLGVVDELAERGGLGIQQRGLRRDFHALGDGTDLEGEVERCGLVDDKAKVVALLGAKARLGDVDLVVTGRQSAKGIEALLIGDGAPNDLSGDVGRDHIGAH